jgi:hypothetical protein
MKRATRRGNSIIEVVAASVIIAAALVPALRMMRDNLIIGRDVENADMMSTLCASRLEQSLASVCGTWDTTTLTGNYSAQGYSNLKYMVTKSDQVADGGIVNRLMCLTAIVWDDTDGDNSLDSNEKRVRYSSKIARFVSYNYEATGM